MQNSFWTIKVDSIHFSRKLSGIFAIFSVLLHNFLIPNSLIPARRTEFHIKFLWGCKGAFVAAEERHLKFEQVLGMMADKLANKSEWAADTQVL